MKLTKKLTNLTILGLFCSNLYAAPPKKGKRRVHRTPLSAAASSTVDESRRSLRRGESVRRLLDFDARAALWERKGLIQPQHHGASAAATASASAALDDNSSSSSEDRAIDKKIQQEVNAISYGIISSIASLRTSLTGCLSGISMADGLLTKIDEHQAILDKKWKSTQKINQALRALLGPLYSTKKKYDHDEKDHLNQFRKFLKILSQDEKLEMKKTVSEFIIFTATSEGSPTSSSSDSDDQVKPSPYLHEKTRLALKSLSEVLFDALIESDSNTVKGSAEFRSEDLTKYLSNGFNNLDDDRKKIDAELSDTDLESRRTASLARAMNVLAQEDAKLLDNFLSIYDQFHIHFSEVINLHFQSPKFIELLTKLSQILLMNGNGKNIYGDFAATIGLYQRLGIDLEAAIQGTPEGKAPVLSDHADPRHVLFSSLRSVQERYGRACNARFIDHTAQKSSSDSDSDSDSE